VRGKLKLGESQTWETKVRLGRKEIQTVEESQTGEECQAGEKIQTVEVGLLK
jgi:hypothetical protein